MKLVKLKVINFRQFLGENTIEFSNDVRAPTTVIHGENGVGKTTILNAIFWCFYGSVLKDFELPENLVNDIARLENGVEETTVEIFFEHNDTNYRITRVYNQPRTDSTDVQGFRLEGGNSVPIKGIQAVISRIIPRSMAPYFFFHGEGLNSFVGGPAKQSFRGAIRSILGFNYADQTIKLLSSIRIKWQKEAAKLSKLDAAGQAALATMAKTEEELASARDENQEAQQNLNHVEDSLDEINEELAKVKVQNIDRLNSERMELEDRQRKIPREIKKIREDKLNLLSKYGWSIFGHSFLISSAAKLDEFRTERKLPAEYNDVFVRGLLKDRICICGTCLDQNSEARKLVEAMLAGAATSEQEDAITKATGIAESIRDVADEYVGRKNSMDVDIAFLEQEKGNNARRLEEIGEQLGTIDRPKIAKLEADRADQTSLAKRLRDSVTLSNIKVNNARKELEDAKKQKRKVVDVSKLEGYEQRQDFIESIIALTRKTVELEEASARVDIEALINERLDKFSRKDYFVEVREDFSFVLKKQDGMPVAKSKGERTLLNIAFIASLIQLAKSRSSEENEYFVQGTVAPFVIDAPFGELDNEYRAAVAQFLPESTDQLVTLVSSSHWGKNIEENLRHSIGKEYVLIAESSQSLEAGKTLDRLEIGGKEIECARYGMDYTQTVIERV